MKPQARIEKLRDKKGVYGYGIFGVDKHKRHTVILRPDRIVPGAPSSASFFQQLPPLAISRGWFKRSAEWSMTESLTNSFLGSSGAILDDTCIILSILLQHGVQPSSFVGSMGRLGPGGEPASIIGRLAGLLVR